MKKVLLLTTLVALAVPASAQAYSIRDFRIRDAGNRIVAKVVVCTDSPATSRDTSGPPSCPPSFWVLRPRARRST